MLNQRLLKKRKEGDYRRIKGSIQQEDLALDNIYVPNIGTPKHININKHKGGAIHS